MFYSRETATEDEDDFYKEGIDDSDGEEARAAIPAEDEGCRLVIRPIDASICRESMKEVFGECGAIKDTCNTGRGFAFIEYYCPDDASRAICQLNGTRPFGLEMKVKHARRR